MKQIIYYLQYLFYRTTLFLISLIPFKAALFLADHLGGFLLKFNKRRMEITRFNLKKAFGSQKSEREIEDIIRRMNGRLFQIAVEFSKIPQLSKKKDKTGVLRGNPEIIWDALKKGKGAVLLVSHLGNWELAAIGGGLEGYPIYTIGKQDQNPFVSQYIQKIRGRTNTKTINKYDSVQDVSSLLKQNQVVCLPIDQRVKDGEPTHFLGQTAYFSTLPALLAIRYDTAVIPCFLDRKPGPVYTVKATPPLQVVKGENLRESLRLTTSVFAKRIEEEIMKDPSDWVLWRHNIWKR